MLQTEVFCFISPFCAVFVSSLDFVSSTPSPLPGLPSSVSNSVRNLKRLRFDRVKVNDGLYHSAAANWLVTR